MLLFYFFVKMILSEAFPLNFSNLESSEFIFNFVRKGIDNKTTCFLFGPVFVTLVTAAMLTVDLLTVDC